MELRPKKIIKYVTEFGGCPYDEWFEALKDKRTQAVIATRLNRIAQGNYGLCRHLEGNVWEIKIDFGPGFRVYFGEDGNSIVVLLCAGDKSTQSDDIRKAQLFWQEYLRSE